MMIIYAVEPLELSEPQPPQPRDFLQAPAQPIEVALAKLEA